LSFLILSAVADRYIYFYRAHRIIYIILWGLKSVRPTRSRSSITHMTLHARPRFCCVVSHCSRMISGIKARGMVTAYACPYISSSLYMDEQFFVLPRSRRPTDGGEPPFRSILSEGGKRERGRGKGSSGCAAISLLRSPLLPHSLLSLYPLFPSNDFRIVPAVRTDRPAEF